MTSSGLWDMKPEPVMSGAKVLNEENCAPGNFRAIGEGEYAQETHFEGQRLRSSRMVAMSSLAALSVPSRSPSAGSRFFRWSSLNFSSLEEL